MSKVSNKPQSSQAYFTSGISGLITAACIYFFDDNLDLLKLTLIFGAIGSPFITLLLVNAFAWLNVDPALIKYKAALARDLKKQKKILEDPLIDQAAKDIVKERYSTTSILLSSANQDHANGIIDIHIPEDNIPV